MYINRIIEENIGPIENAQMVMPFNEKCPKPVIIVGENGTGKSTIISNIVDSFYEIAGTAYLDARKQGKTVGYEYYKSITPIEIHAGKQYLCSYIKYEDEDRELSAIEYVFKSGMLDANEFKSRIGITSQIAWKKDENFKHTTVDKENAEKFLEQEILCYFGPDRYEKPFWMGKQYYETMEYEHITVKPRFNGEMELPILINGMTAKTLQWLLDVIVDSRGDIESDGNGGVRLENVTPNDVMSLGVARKNIEKIMSNIIGEDVYFGLNFRSARGSRFNIKRKKIIHF